MLCDLNMTYASFPPPHVHHIHHVCHIHQSTASTASAMSIASPHPPHPSRPRIHHIHRVLSQSAKQLAYRGRLHAADELLGEIYNRSARVRRERTNSAVKAIRVTVIVNRMMHAQGLTSGSADSSSRSFSSVSSGISG